MRRQHFLSLLIGSAQSFAGTIFAFFRHTSVGSLAVFIRSGMPQDTALRTNILVIYRIVFILPGFVSIFFPFPSRIRQNRYLSIIQYLFCNPRCFIAGIHCYKLYFKFARYFVIYLIPCHTVVNIARCHCYTQYHTVFIAGCMCFIGKLPFVLAFHKHTAFRIGCGHRLFFCSTAFGQVIIVVIFYGLFSKLFPLLIYLLVKLFRVNLCCLCHFLFLVFLLIGTGFDMRSVYKNHAGIYHPVIQSLIQNVLKDLAAQFLRKTLAEGITHRGKMRDIIQ